METQPVSISVVCRKPQDRVWLKRLRQWSVTDPDRLGRRAIDQVTPIDSITDAVEWQIRHPGERIVVAIGFDAPDVRDAIPRAPVAGMEPVILKRPQAGPPCARDGAIGRDDRIAETVDVLPEVRRAVIRLRGGGDGGDGRVVRLTTPAQFRAYLALRHKVWSGEGYIDADDLANGAGLELDYTDRTATPVGVFARDGRLVGCARLVQELGNEIPDHVRAIAAVIAEAGDPALFRRFEYPKILAHPFDILHEFEGFRHRYAGFIKQRISVAEVSRVIVDEGYRGRGFAELMVEELVQIGRERGIDHLILACREAIAPLYMRCGFAPVPGLKSDKFINIPVPSIVMERSLEK